VPELLRDHEIELISYHQLGHALARLNGGTA
jgi:hypothetical protein